MKVSVISPERVLFEGEASAVVAPAHDGEVGILARHAPMVALLGKGRLRLEGAGGQGEGEGEGGRGSEAEGTGGRRFDVSGGFLHVADDVVRVVTESATPAP